MVIKTHLLAIVSLLSLSAFAADKNIENLKLMQLYLDKNQPEKVEDIFDENEDELSGKWMALERLALSFERREKFKESIEVYRKIINNFNKTAHEKIIRTPVSAIRSEMYESNKLPFYYYKLAFLNTQLFSRSHSYMDETERNKYKRNAEGFIGLARKVKTDEGDIKLIEDQLKEKVSIESSLQYKSKWYAMVEIVSWQDHVHLINTATSQKHNLLNTSLGSCIGAGKNWQNSKYEFDAEGCLVMATSTISSESSAVTYQQSKVPVTGAIFGPGMYFKAISENVLLGFQIPVMYRKGDWSLPENLPYRFEKDKSIGIGYFIQSKFKVKRVFIRTRLGKIFPNPGSHWSLGLVYDF